MIYQNVIKCQLEDASLTVQNNEKHRKVIENTK